jgi:hypothetical protein
MIKEYYREEINAVLVFVYFISFFRGKLRAERE